MAETTLAEDLRKYLYETVGNHPAGQPAHWVMNTEWLNECRRMEDRHGYPVYLPFPPARLLGLPIEIRDDGGAPHLVLDD